MSATGDYSIARLSANTRSKIRRGLNANEVRRLSGAELARSGERAFLDTVERQGRAGQYRLDRWHRLLAAADATSGVEIWSAWRGKVLAAYLFVLVFEDRCELYEARSRNDELRHYPNNALVYWVTEEMLVRRRLAEATFGIQGLEDVPSLDHFKLTMGFTRRPIRQRVVFHPVLRAALTIPPLRAALNVVAAQPWSPPLWRRARGLLHFASDSYDEDHAEVWGHRSS
jgi:hypothetical protein